MRRCWISGRSREQQMGKAAVLSREGRQVITESSSLRSWHRGRVNGSSDCFDDQDEIRMCMGHERKVLAVARVDISIF